MLQTTLGGRYQIINHLGGGGFGQTYLAEDLQLPGNPKCVVKKLQPQASDPATLETARRLFETEAQMLYKLGSHPQIPKLYAYFEENNEFYLVQEFIEGCSLIEEFKGNAGWEEAKVISLLREILEILEFVHSQNVIHRDVNPHNIIRRATDGKLVLIDFGAVKQITTQSFNALGQTNLSVIIGTPGYMPSEQANGFPKPSSDIYAVGVLAIQSLINIYPNQFKTDANTLEIIWREGVGVSDELAVVLDKMVRYDFRQRYASAGEALQALQNMKSGKLPTMPVGVSSPAKLQVRGRMLIKALLVLVLGFGVSAAGYFAVQVFNNSSATGLYNQANTLLKLKRQEEAIKLLEKAVKLKPDYAEAWEIQAQAFYGLKRYKEALEAFDKAIYFQPEFLEAWVGRGLVLAQLKKYNEAIDAFEQGLKIQPNSAKVWYEKGELLLQLQRYDEAVVSYEKASEFQPNFYEAWERRGWALHSLRRYEDAVNSYKKAVEIKPDYAKAWYNMGNSMARLEWKKEAVNAYEKAVKFDDNYYLAWKSLGNALSNLREYKEALESYQKAVSLRSDDAESWYQLGWGWHQLSRFDKALEAYNTVLNLQSNYPGAWYNHGNVLYTLRRYEEAVKSYENAVDLKADDYQAWYSKGNALFQLKRYEEARVAYQKTVVIKPDFKEGKDALLKIENLLNKEGDKQAFKDNKSWSGFNLDLGRFFD
ncbi:tetratricopeptide repeat protein [Ancylothrix sp. C2]|uniref:serine/threonine-protein kinase n=1 Tax=Ancylothrix sp. D3o TaxID=2953691 RepID=UPI0021BA99EF|nr:serine/threonine-protein kinase [Ancylothrix sp. D3o]MCT7951694.1 tetratricopeptide repeat protein [Ancylothrix sp. D3o]